MRQNRAACGDSRELSPDRNGLYYAVFPQKEAPVGELHQRPFQTALRPSQGSRIAWVVVGLLVLGGAAVLLWRWNQSRVARPVAAPVAEGKPAAPEAAAPPALPMAQGDAQLKDAAGGLSS